MNIEYRLARRSDIPQLVSLINKQYKRKKNDRYFLWQYFDSVYPTLLYVAVSRSNIVGMFGLQKKRLISGAVCGQAIDLLVDVSRRGKGVFKQLGDLALNYWNDIDVFLVLPNASGKKACERAFGWKTVVKIDELVLSADSSSEINDQGILNDDGQLCEMFFYDSKIRTWRYDLNPLYNYEYIKLSDSVYSVVKLFLNPETHKSCGDIVEYHCDVNDFIMLKELLSKSVENLKTKNTKHICTWALPHTMAYHVFKKMGFCEEMRERYLCLKVLNKSFNKLQEGSCWNIIQADAEVY